MEQAILISVKKEYEVENNEDEYIIPDQGNNTKIKCETDNQLDVNEIDLGPVKIEPLVKIEIKPEDEGLNLNEHSATEDGNCTFLRLKPLHRLLPVKKSNNRREIVRDIHQRLLNLDKAINPSNKLTQLRQRCKDHKSAFQPISSAQHMRDLRQRLMNLDNQLNPPDTAKSRDSQVKPEFQRRLLRLNNGNTTCKTTKNTQDDFLLRRTSPKSSAQRMREMRQRRCDLNNSNGLADNNQSNKSRPPTPPELSARRMRDFRQRLLQLDKSHQDAQSQIHKQRKGLLPNHVKS
ncbi:uncharacterized protein LOC6566490 [Drosophila grimshawi]|uniref:GH13266 n=1 Tax=Drosophila grimshawi TaxID=7222 RepID=B4JQ55_DROGR|nr:uncharacterized protein LOC6566490 [Drosophila grimshawi]EDV99035.1 GH13266 [Drosophila grimshawi]